MKLARFAEQVFAREFLKDLNVEAAARRVGIVRSPAYYGNALMKRRQVQSIIQAEMQARSHRLQIDADAVLSALIQQLARLTSMLGQDIAALYDEFNCLKPVAAWPEMWRKGLVGEIETKELFAYSKDGTQGGESKAWDKIGDVKKIKRESTLAIEKQIRETLRAIGEHVGVKAFQPRPGAEVNVMVVTAERARELDGARKRLRIVTPPDETP